MFAFPLFLASHSTLGWAALAGVLAWCFGIPGLLLSYYAWALYVPIGIKALQEGRADRAAAAAALADGAEPPRDPGDREQR